MSPTCTMPRWTRDSRPSRPPSNPPIMIGMGLVVAAIVVTMYLPIFNLSSATENAVGWSSVALAMTNIAVQRPAHSHRKK